MPSLAQRRCGEFAYRRIKKMFRAQRFTLSEHCFELRGRQWPAEEITLHLFAAMMPQICQLLGRFDAFGNDVQPQTVRQRND